VGKYQLDVCTTLSCSLLGAEHLVDYLSRKLGIRVGETTPDGVFTLRTVECLGDCGRAPVMMVGDRYYDDLTPEKLDGIIDELRDKAGG
jgi:NADH-quinone oxidoreductase subunit E